MEFNEIFEKCIKIDWYIAEVFDVWYRTKYKIDNIFLKTYFHEDRIAQMKQ